MAKKEFKVGETFQCGSVKLKVEDICDYHCDRCYLAEYGCIGQFSDIVGACNGIDREDSNNVIFVKVEE